MIQKFLARLRRYDTVSAEEEDALRAAADKVVDFARGEVIVPAKVEQRWSNLLVDGFTVRSKSLRDGARQVLELSLAGDFIDLHSFTMKELDHDIVALTPGRMLIFPHDRLQDLVARHPHLGRLLWLTTMIDASIHREWMLSLGRRDALSRTANLFCELRVRLETVGLATEKCYELPLTQADLADLLGLTPVHVNRTLRELRERGALFVRRKAIEILDWPQLVEIAEFDPFYLTLRQRPR